MNKDELKDKMFQERVQDLDKVDVDERYDDMLDECGTVEVGSLTFDASRVLKELDPIAYNCGFSDWLDSAGLYEHGDDYYEQEEIDELREDIDNEVDDSDFLRFCDECGQLMPEGYCISGGEEYYCSAKCLNVRISPEEWARLYDNGNGDSYWTDWEYPAGWDY